MELLLVFVPLFTFAISISFSFLFGFYGSAILTLSGMVLVTIGSTVVLLNSILYGRVSYITLTTWFAIDFLEVDWSFYFDSLVSVMLVVVSTISLVVHFYSCGYMDGDPHHSRFMAYLSLFTFFMLFLVSSANMVQLFLGWEGVGLASYLLINFWYGRAQANKSALKAMVVNRVGDSFLILSMVLIYNYFGTFDFPVFFSIVHGSAIDSCGWFGFEIPLVSAISILVFFGSMGKSAQLGLHSWLPDAMEGPTPVSALIHAATMVTAGVFLVVRFSSLFEYSSFSLSLVSFLGALTALFASTVALFQFDLKKVVAYSTCSQLGYMFLACGLSCYDGAMFHLYNHAFFKALLFLGSGFVIHAIYDNQDLRRMGGMHRLIGFSYSTFLVGSLSLAGFPFLTGFYSKDFILESTSVWFSFIGKFCLVLGLFTAFLTAFYSIRVIYLVYFSIPRAPFTVYGGMSFRSINGFMIPSLALLSFLSIFVGYFSKDFMVGAGSDFWGSSIFILPIHSVGSVSEFIPFYIKLLPVIFSFLGILFSIVFNFWFVHMVLRFQLMYNYISSFFHKKWYFDLVFNSLIVLPVLSLAYRYLTFGLDRGVFEKFGPWGIGSVFSELSRGSIGFQTGYVYHYIFVMIFSMVFIFSSFLMFGWFTLYVVSVCFPIFFWITWCTESDWIFEVVTGEHSA